MHSPQEISEFEEYLVSLSHVDSIADSKRKATAVASTIQSATTTTTSNRNIQIATVAQEVVAQVEQAVAVAQVVQGILPFPSLHSASTQTRSCCSRSCCSSICCSSSTRYTSASNALFNFVSMFIIHII